MTLQNLSKLLDKYERQKQLGTIILKQFKPLQGLPFHNFLDCADPNTFNHAIGLPTKNWLAYPLFEYVGLPFNTL